MPVTEVFAAMTVRDRDSAIGFYERLLGAPPTMLPNDDEAAWQLTGGGWLYVLRDPDRAGRSVVTLLVDDFDDRLASAAAARIELGPVETVAGSVRTTWITDPDGSVPEDRQLGGEPSESHLETITAEPIPFDALAVSRHVVDQQ